MKIQRILVAIDFSGQFQPSLEHTKSLSEALRAKVTLIHVVPVRVHVYQRPQITAAAAELDKLVLREFGGLADSRVRSGCAEDEILREAIAGEYDLIVMGTHRRRGLPRMLVGSVAENVIRRSPCPVFIVRNSTKAQNPVNRLLFPTDLTTASLAALHLAVRLAMHVNAEVDVVHVASRRDPSFTPTPSALQDKIREHLLGLGVGNLSYDPTTGMRFFVREGRVATEVARHAEEQSCDLIVMSTHGRRGFMRAALGSVTESVIRSTKCSVLTVRSSQTRIPVTRAE